MNYRALLDSLCQRMIAYDAGDPKRIQHFMKVSGFASVIARSEGLDEHLCFLLEAAGYVHDIGIKAAEFIYGYQTGHLQEELGPGIAADLLSSIGFSEQDTVRLCHLISVHHTYSDLKDIDHQILVEADFLVNLYEKNSAEDEVRKVYDTIFKTETGKNFFRHMFLEERNPKS